MLPLLGETRARAAVAANASRLIVVVKPNGVQSDAFWPTAAGGSLVGATFPHVTSPLEAFRDKLTFIDGLTLRNWLRAEGNTTGDNGDAHHNWASLLTGELPSDRLLTDGGCRSSENPAGCRMQAGGPSIDCYVARRLKELDASLVFDSLHVSLNSDDLATARKAGGFSCPSWFDRDQPNAQEPDPLTVYSKLFDGVTPLPGETDAAASAKMRDRLRLLDFVGKDLERFSRRLGSEDRVLTEAHLDSVRRRQQELERIVNNKLACMKPGEPSGSYIVKQEAHIPDTSRVMMDLIVDAMKCGLTRAAAYSLYDSNAYHAYFSWLADINPNIQNQAGPQISEFPTAHLHAMAHGSGNDPGTTMYRDANRWMVEQYAYLLARLEGGAEVSGTLLDNTLVLWLDSLSNGGGHHVTRLPCILAGNANNYFATGRHLKLPATLRPMDASSRARRR